MIKAYQKWLKINDEKMIEQLKKMTKEEIIASFGGALSFGTAGLRGIMGLGTNRINEVNICKLANAIADFASKKKLGSVVIGFDTRHNSKTYSRIFAKVLSSRGLKVNLFKNYVPTPVLTFSINALGADLGIMITASHNNKIYNGVKISTKEGIQISGDNEKLLGSLYEKQDEIKLFNDFLALKRSANKNIKYVKNQIKRMFLGDFYKNKINSELNIIYTPLNGTAYAYVKNALRGSGFSHIRTPLKQKFANGNFVTCPYPNPEFVETYKEALKCTEFFDADVIVATDPDGDRLGAMIKSTKGYKLLTGNEVAFLLLCYTFENRVRNSGLYAVSTVVSSPMFFDICDDYGIKYEKTLIGFKNIGRGKLKLEEKYSKDGFVLAYEEACGYVVKDNLYDKDGIFALLKFCELASYLKNKGSSVEEYLDEIYNKFGNIYSLNSSIAFEGENALVRMNQKVDELRVKGIKTLMRKKILSKIDYLEDKTGLDKSNFIEYKAQDFSFVIRPSGTEPKLKFYIHAKGKNLNQSKKLAEDVLIAIKKEIFGLDE